MSDIIERLREVGVTTIIDSMADAEEIKRLREAMRFYAAPTTYEEEMGMRPASPIQLDRGERARSALDPEPSKDFKNLARKTADDSADMLRVLEPTSSKAEGKAHATDGD